LQIGYTRELITTRQMMLERAGYRVSSVQGNDQARALNTRQLASAELVLIGFSAPYRIRAEILEWLKDRAPELRVMVMLAHSLEKFPDADCVTLSEDPEVWLSAVANAIPGSKSSSAQ
jgi:DNA-binding NtrC family response regulator